MSKLQMANVAKAENSNIGINWEAVDAIVELLRDNYKENNNEELNFHEATLMAMLILASIGEKNGLFDHMDYISLFLSELYEAVSQRIDKTKEEFYDEMAEIAFTLIEDINYINYMEEIIEELFQEEEA